jgi:16S rRNA (guanine527-N7)-methyltransferase
VNLTSLSLDDAPADTIDRLFIEPAIAAAEIPPATPADLIDIGSGGGSPAIPLKVLRPQLRLTMVESRQRKASFLREVARQLELTETTVVAERFERMASRLHGDLVSIRAVRLDEPLAHSIEKCLKADAVILFFGASEIDYPSNLSLVRKLPLTAPDRVLHVLSSK